MVMVLIAEDDIDINVALTRLFTRAGLVVISAPDGAVALQLAIERHPDVVVTDLDMPGMTGLQLCQALRADPVLHDVPVALLSGSLRYGDPRAAEVQACGAWLKPLPNAKLVSAVRDLLAAGRHGHDQPSPCPLATVGA